MKKRKATIAFILVLCLIIGGTPQTVLGLSKIKEQSDPFEMMVDVTPDLMSIQEIIDSTYQTKVDQKNGDIDGRQVVSNAIKTDLQPSDYEDIDNVKGIIEDTAKEINDDGTNVETDSMLLENVLKGQQDLVEQIKTNRFIVKYKKNGEKSFKEKVKNEIQDIVTIDNLIPKDAQTNIKNNSEKLIFDSAGQFIKETVHGIANLGNNENSIQLITLEESINPGKFADMLKKKNVEDDIEYIQPDFQMQLNAVDDLSEKTPIVDSSEKPVLEETSAKTLMIDETITDDTAINQNISILTNAGISEEKTTEEFISDQFNDEEAIKETDTKEAITQEELTDILQKSKEKVIVAVMDTGLDITHTDLKSHIYVNSDEIPDNCIDDDGNGYIDDVNGWSFLDNSGTVYNESLGLEQAHATHIAGIITGLNNADDNLISNDNIEILPLKVFSNGAAYTSDIIAAIDYAEKMGAQVINCSFGSTDKNLALKEAIENSGMLFICSVGNARTNLDITPVYPACFELDNIISVTSTNADGGLSYFSNYSSNLVDVAALGRDINSTLPDGKYGLQTGTSMSTAMVSSVVVAVLGVDNTLDAIGLKERLINTSDRLSNLQQEVSGGRQVNALNAMNNLEQMEIMQNSPASDFDVIGYHPTQEELYQLYSSGRVVQAEAGEQYTLILKDDGTVWAWGSNTQGQCGNGLISEYESLTQVIGLKDIVSISAGCCYNLALRSNGAVFAWGNNYYGQLGDGTTTNKAIPVLVEHLDDVVSISAGRTHSLAAKRNGQVYAWGDNSYGQLGDGTTTNRSIPNRARIISALSISAGSTHSLVAKENGQVYAWGDNSYGQLGDGTTTNRLVPVRSSGLNYVISISTGEMHSLALKSDGTVWAWGDNSCGELGDDTWIDRSTPVQVVGLSDVTSVSAGCFFSLALKSDGTVWVLGDYLEGLFEDERTNLKIPEQSDILNGVVRISTKWLHNVVMKSDGTVWAWGDYVSGFKPIQCSTYVGKLDFDINIYAGEIPSSGTSNLVVHAAGVDSYGKIISDAEIRYSLENIYTGVSINNITGEITIEPSATTGYIQVIATYKNLTCSVSLHVIPTIDAKGLTFHCVKGKDVYIPYRLNKASHFDNTFILRYNGAELEVIDFVCQTKALENSDGMVTGSGIEILSYTPGIIQFKVNKEIDSSKIWSGIVNVFKFKAKITGETSAATE